jgi:hypothetical protein
MGFLNALKTFLSSKKWYMTILGSAIVMALNHFGFPEYVQAIIGGLFGTYVIGQGIADKPKV